MKTNRSSCTKDHSGQVPDQKIADLPESQPGAWRHRCAACAYQLGVEEGIRAAFKGDKNVAVVLEAVRENLAVEHLGEVALDRAPEAAEEYRVPQANRLSTVRQLVFHIRHGRTEVNELSESCGFSPRQASFYRQAAEILGLLSHDKVTDLGNELLGTKKSSPEEGEVLTRAVMMSQDLQPVAWFFSDVGKEPTEKALARFLAKKFKMAATTAHRRAASLMQWRKSLKSQVAVAIPEKKQTARQRQLQLQLQS